MRLRAGLALAALLAPALAPAAYLDVALDSIIQPRGAIDSGVTVRPLAIVRNNGNVPTAFNVTMMIGPDYIETVARTLPAGTADIVQFSGWVADPVGPVPVVAFTTLTGDENPANDTVVGSATVTRLPPHDIETVDVLSPPVTMRAGDVITPRALIRNRGASLERYFDVRLRIPPLYDQTVTVESIAVNSAAEVAFPEWTAVAGLYQVSCSTQLAGDVNPENDRQQVSVRVLQPLDLFIERDQSGLIRAGETRNYQFYAEIQGDYGDIVSVTPVVAPSGWEAELYDSTGLDLLGDNNGDGIPDLDFLDPNTRRPFLLRVRARAALAGDTTPPSAERIIVRGFAGSETLVTDSAALVLTLVPDFEVHNFPNPFEDATRFVIGLPESGTVSLTVYDRSARLIARVLENRELAAGPHVFQWTATTADGNRLAPGTYVYMLEFVHGNLAESITSRLVISRE